MTTSIDNCKSLLIILGVCVSLFSCKKEPSESRTESVFLIDSIFSSHLNEYRKHNIYLPQDFNSEKKYPIIYATDGNSNITDKKEVFDSLIEAKTIKPFIFVASFANGKIGDSTSTTRGDGSQLLLTYRYFEYVKQTFTEDNIYPHLEDRFENHMAYFSRELIPKIESKYHQKPKKENRYFYGVSNGAGFGLSLLNHNPELIGTYLCFSTFGGDIQTNTWDVNTNYPNLYLRYGSDEPFFLKEDAEFLKSKFKDANSFIDVKTFQGNHNDQFWSAEFIEIMSNLLK